MSNDLVKKLRKHATDWNGQQMADGEPAKSDPTAGFLRKVADFIEALEGDVSELTTERNKARAYAGEARIRENAAEDARVSASFKLTVAEARIEELEADLADANLIAREQTQLAIDAKFERDEAGGTARVLEPLVQIEMVCPHCGKFETFKLEMGQ